MGPINSVPLGFLDFLGLQQQGRNLAQLADVLAGTVDLTNFLFQWHREILREDTAFAGAATSAITVGTVPAGQQWVVLGGMIQNTSGPGGTGFAHVEIAAGPTAQVTERLSMAVANNGQALPVNFQFNGWVVVPPGGVITKYGYGLAGAGAEQCLCRLIIARLSI